MDISEMMVWADKETGRENSAGTILAPPTDLDAISPNAAENSEKSGTITAVEMSAVERIRAYRSGTLVPPMLGRPTEADDPDADALGGEPQEQHGGGASDTAGQGAIADAGSDGPIVPEPGEFPASSSGRRLPRRALLVAAPVAALIVAGLVMQGARRGDAPPAVTEQQSVTGAGVETTQAAAAAPVKPETVITPVKAEGPEYPISLTPPMDAFSGHKGKGWICAGLDGTVLTITLPAPMVITEIGVVPGLEGTDKDGSELWAKHRIVTSVAYNLDYGDPVYAEYANKRERQVTQIPNVVTQTIRPNPPTSYTAVRA